MEQRGCLREAGDRRPQPTVDTRVDIVTPEGCTTMRQDSTLNSVIAPPMLPERVQPRLRVSPTWALAAALELVRVE
jgi:hypothetical protein